MFYHIALLSQEYFFVVYYLSLPDIGCSMWKEDAMIWLYLGEPNQPNGWVKE